MELVKKIIFVIVLFYGCEDATKPIVKKSKSIINVESNLSKKVSKQSKITKNKSDSNCDINSIDLKHILSLSPNLRTFIFPSSVKVYCLPNTSSDIVRILEFSDSQYAIEEYVLCNGEYWYKLKGWSPNFIRGGYVKANVMSDFYTSLSKFDLGYLGKVVTGLSNYKYFSIKLFNTETNKVFQEYKIPNYYSYHKIENIYSHTLKNVNYLFHFETDEEECPGRYYEEFIVEANNKLIKLWSYPESENFEENEDEAKDLKDEFYKIYIPISTFDGVVLAPWGKFDKILKNDLSLDIFEYKPSIGVPIDDLIVFKETKIYKSNIKKINIKYYKWTGGKLELVKKTINKILIK